MPRPVKCRRVCGLPENTVFGPVGGNCSQTVTMTVDEYETLRLIDLEGLTQEECAAQMGIARATVAGIWTRARRKTADALVNGKQLTVAGGNYMLCRHSEPSCCGKRSACRGEIDRKGQELTSEGDTMKIAATYENGLIFQHFGHTEQFKIYTIENDRIVKMEVVDTNGSGHGALSKFLKDQGVGILICGGIGGGARMALMEAGIAVFAGAAGEADLQVGALLAGMLAPNPDVTCDHHDHGEGHSCGTCGSHGTCGGHCGG